MKNNFLFWSISFFLLLGMIIGFLFFKKESMEDKKIVHTEKYIKNVPKIFLHEKIEKVSVLEKKPVTMRVEKKVVEAEKSTLANEAKHLSLMERRKEMDSKKKHYMMQRRKWIRALDKARKEAKVNGDYSVYEMIKADEPVKF